MVFKLMGLERGGELKLRSLPSLVNKSILVIDISANGEGGV